jgi:FkbM family methyltransferase
MRDAIVFSLWNWENYNVPERVSLALARLGARVLYCDNPTSILSRPERLPREISKGVYRFQPVLLGQRLNAFALLRAIQVLALQKQIDRVAAELQLRDPLFFYFFMKQMFPLLQRLKGRRFLTYVCMDHHELDADACASISDATLVIPPSVFHQFRAKFGPKVHLIPQSVDFSALAQVARNGSPEPAVFDGIPHPRLGYLGPAHDRLNNPVLLELLRSHPEWHFVSIGPQAIFPIPNAHALPWGGPEEVARYAGALDIGFLPYNCYQERQLHCVPLKLFEHFALGTPVVATLMVHLWEYSDVVYLGDTASELAVGIEAALNEPPDSPKRAARIEIARSHSIESLAAELRRCLPLDRVDAEQGRAVSAKPQRVSAPEFAAVSLSPKLRGLYRYVRNVPGLGGIVQRTASRLLPRGRRVWVQVRLGLAQGLWLNVDPRYDNEYVEEVYEPALQEVLAAHLGRGGSFYDVGAHIGFFSLIAARLVGESGAVFAFEPDPENARRIEQHSLRAGFPQICVLPVAVWSQSTTVPFQHNCDFSSHNTGFVGTWSPERSLEETIKVKAVTLDEFAESHRAPTLIKVDVEGGEVDVLKGAERIFSKARPALICEVHNQDASSSVEAYLAEKGYSLQWLDREADSRRHLLAQPRVTDASVAHAVAHGHDPC